MSVLNQMTCELVRAYIGQNRCDITFGTPRMLIAVPYDKEFTAADILAWQTTLSGLSHEDDPSLRIYPINVEKGIEDNSDDPTNFSYPDGSSIQVRDEVYRWRLEHGLGFCYQKNLLDLNNSESQYSWFIVDNNNVAWGTVNSSGNFMGARPSQFRVHKAKVATPSDPMRFYVTIEFSDTTQLNENGGFVKANFNLLRTLDGIRGVDLSLVSWTSGANGTVNVMAKTACGGLNMADEYPALASPSLWVATNTSTGAAIDIDAVTKVTVSGESCFLFDLDAADTDYPAALGELDITLADPSVLDAASISWFGSDPLTLTRPA